MKFKAKTKAWITPYSSVSPAELLKGECLEELSFSAQDMSGSGWTMVGHVEFTVELMDQNAMIKNKVEALRAEAKSIRAEATAKVTRIEGQINDLLALTFEPVTSA